MAAEHAVEAFSQLAAAWAVPVLMGITAIGGLFTWVHNELKSIGKAWEDRAVKIEAANAAAIKTAREENTTAIARIDSRIGDLAAGQIRDHDAWKHQVDEEISGLAEDFDGKLAAHASATEASFRQVHARVDDVYRDMATRKDLDAVRGDTSQILLLLAGRNQKGN